MIGGSRLGSSGLLVPECEPLSEGLLVHALPHVEA